MIKTKRKDELLRALSVISNYMNLAEPKEFNEEEKKAILSIQLKLKGEKNEK